MAQVRSPLSLHLERPLVVLDTETTGADPIQDHIVQLAWIRLMPDGATTEFETLVNPEMPIPAEARAVHGISNEDVEFAPPFRRIAPDLLQAFEGVDLAGYNLLRFDLPLLRNEFQRAGHRWDPAEARVLDAQIIFHKREPRDLKAAYRFYCGLEHAGAHGALADTRATLEVLLAQVDHYLDLPRDVKGLDALFNQPDPQFVDTGRRFRWRDGEPVFNFGEYRGQSLRSVAQKNPDYLTWMLKKDFSGDVRVLVQDALDGKIAPKSQAGVVEGPVAEASESAEAREKPNLI